MSSGLSKETLMSIEASSMFPGFRFSPTDVELISYYLKKKIEGAENFVEIIPEVEICKHEPWDLPGRSVIQSENEWFFFSSRGRKYPNGSQSKRATELGYWKATGKERNVKSGTTVIGTKRTLVFHVGRAPKGERSEWIMHEYCMQGRTQDSLVVCRLRKNTDFRQNESSSRRNVPAAGVRNSSNVASGIGVDRAESSEGDKAAEYLKKCSSSHDSHSIEQFDLASESDQKLSGEFQLAESSSQHQKDCEDEEDFYADILKDDIIKLDETSSPATPNLLPLVASKFEPLALPQQPADFIMSQAIPLWTTQYQELANRRLKLNQPATTSAPPAEKENHDEKKDRPDSEKPSSCLFGVIPVNLTTRRHIIVWFGVVLSLLAFLLSFLGATPHVKRLMHNAVYKALNLLV